MKTHIEGEMFEVFGKSPHYENHRNNDKNISENQRMITQSSINHSDRSTILKTATQNLTQGHTPLHHIWCIALRGNVGQRHCLGPPWEGLELMADRLSSEETVSCVLCIIPLFHYNHEPSECQKLQCGMIFGQERPDIGLSDHALILHSLPLTSNRPLIKSKPPPYYQINLTNLNNLSLALHDVIWDDIIVSNNANTAFDQFYHCFSTLFYQNIP